MNKISAGAHRLQNCHHFVTDYLGSPSFQIRPSPAKQVNCSTPADFWTWDEAAPGSSFRAAVRIS
jgi:hypothetical protein